MKNWLLSLTILFFSNFLFGQLSQLNNVTSNVDYLSVTCYNGSSVFATYGGRVIRSFNNGNSWDTVVLSQNSPMPLVASTIEQIYCMSNSTLFAVGIFSMGNIEMIVKSTDGGLHWQIVHQNPNVMLPRVTNSIDFANSSLGVVVGNNGRILRTTNGGNSWSPVLSGVQSDIYDVDFANSTNVFACTDGKLLKSTNGGQSWSVAVVDNLQIFEEVHFVNDNVGYASTTAGFIYKTIDGGQTWTSHQYAFDEQIFGGHALQFLTETLGYSLRGGYLYQTVDGGEYWDKISFPDRLRDMWFNDNNNLFVVGEGGQFYKATNGPGNFPPTANFTTSGAPYCNDSTITLTNHGSTSYSYNWKLNNVSFSTSHSPSLTISNPGSANTISVDATHNGITTTKSLNITIENSLNFPLNTSLQTSSLCQGQTNNVIVNSSQAGINYVLQLNNTNIGTSQTGNGNNLSFATGSVNATASYCIKGTKTISGCGSNSVTSCQTITVNSPNTSLSVVSANPATVCYGQNSTVSISNSENNVSYQLMNGTTALSSAQNGNGGTLTFNLTNITSNLSVTVKATRLGCTSNFPAISIAVNKPEILYALSNFNPVVGGSISTINNTFNPGGNLTWSFGNGATPSTAVSQNVSAISYSSAGEKTISLTISTALGCQYTLSKTIEVLSSGSSANCQALTFATAGNVNDFEVKAMTRDDNDNLLMAYKNAYAPSNVVYSGRNDSLKIKQFTYNTNGYTAHIIKCNPNGIPLWAFEIQSGNDLERLNVTSDNNGNIYVTTHIVGYGDSVRCYTPDGRKHAFALVTGNSYLESLFVAKYDSNGNFIWGQVFEETFNGDRVSIEADNAGNVFIAGESIVKKLNANGVEQWGIQTESGDIEPDNQGGVYILIKSGSVVKHINPSGVVDFQNAPFSNADSNDGYTFGTYLKRDEIGNVYIAGTVSNNAQVFGIDTISFTLSGSSNIDRLVYLAKLNSQLNAIWAKKIESNEPIYFSGLDVAQNNVILGIRTRGTTLLLDSETTNASTGANYFLIKTDSLGNNSVVSSFYHSNDPAAISVSMPTDVLKLHGSNQLDFGFIYKENTTTASGTTFQVRPNYQHFGVNLMNVNCLFTPSISNLPVAYFNQSFVGCTNSTFTFTNNSLNNPTTFSWVFDGGNPATSTVANPTVEFATTGTHLIHLTVTNSYGSSQYTSYVTVGDAPNAVITGSTVICYDSDTYFWVTGADSYLWSDGTTLDHMDVRNVRNDFTASVVATSSGCSMLVEYPVTVDVVSNIAILGSIVDTVCSNSDPFELPAAIPEGGYYTSYTPAVNGNTFNPNAGDPDAFTMIYYTYQSPAGCVYEVRDSVYTINNTAYGTLQVQSSSNCVGDSATFTIISNPETTRWLWLPNDNFTTSDNLENQSIHIRFEIAGPLQVDYKVSMLNCPLIQMGSMIGAYALPDASISASQNTACNTDAPIALNYQTSFDDVIYDQWGEINSNYYDLSRSSGNQAVIYHQAWTSEGCMVTDSVVISITDLNASFSFEGNGCPGLPVQFTSSSGVDATTFHWDFNGGVSSQTSLPNPVAQFNNYGSYTVVLTTSHPGCPDDHDTMTVDINGLSVDLASFSVDTICYSANAIPLPVGTPSGGIYSEVGNGINGDLFNPQVGPTGWRTLYYEISNGSGCIGRDSSKIFVLNPVVSITPNTIVCQNQNFTFHGTSTGHPTSWSWGTQNGNITNSTTANPSINYSAAGTFPLNVTVGDNFCPPVSASINVTVAPISQSDVYQTACTQYHWNATNQTYTQSGNYPHTLSSVSGCDSVVTLHLTIHSTTQSTINQTACSQYTWPINGQTYTQSGVYTYLTTNANGCDSTINLNLTIVPTTTTPQNVSNCGPFTWSLNGQTYSTTGVYSHTLTSIYGCDSIIELHLTINSPTALIINGFSTIDNGTCNGTYSTDLHGSGPFSASIDGGTSVSNISQSHIFNQLCGGVHQLVVTDNCNQTVNATIVIPSPTTSIDINPTGSQAVDSSGTTEENCEIDFATIDTAYIYSVTSQNDIATVIWNIVDANGSHLDTVTYNLQSGNGVYFLQLSLYCPNKNIGDYFTVTEAVDYVNGTVHTAGMDEVSGIEFVIYPNPTNDFIQLKASFDIQKVEITNQLGERIDVIDYQKGKQISVKHLAPGYYYLTVNAEKLIILPFIKSNN